MINAGTKNASTEIPLCVLRSALIAVVLLPFILIFIFSITCKLECFTFRNQTADNTPDSGNRSMLPHIPSQL